jgi:hypothetical protein
MSDMFDNVIVGIDDREAGRDALGSRGSWSPPTGG